MNLNERQIALKAATRRAVMLAGGPHAAAKSTRVCAALLSRYGNINCPEIAPADVCADLDLAVGDAVVLRAYADLLGFDLVLRDEATDQLARDMTALAGDLAKESGELISTTIDATRDGAISVNEAMAIDRDAADLQDKIVSIRTAARKTIAKVS
jgi:hypothetical protein